MGQDGQAGGQVDGLGRQKVPIAYRSKQYGDNVSYLIIEHQYKCRCAPLRTNEIQNRTPVDFESSTSQVRTDCAA